MRDSPGLRDHSAGNDPTRISCHTWKHLVLFGVLLLVGGFLAGCAASSQSIILLDQSGGWHASLAIPATALSADLFGLSARLEQNGVHLLRTDLQGLQSAVSSRLELDGTGGVDQVRELLYGDLAGEVQPLGASTALILEGSVQKGEQLTISIESNPSTGFLWQMMPENTTSVSIGEWQDLEQSSNQLGGTAHQVLNITGQADGPARLGLIYKRSWENGTAARTLTIQAPDLHQLTDLTDPRLLQGQSGLPAAQRSVVAVEAAQSFPPVLDLRNQLTMVKDQGSCGSCWAFAATGVFESALSIQAGLRTDLSEQYLMSCNIPGWGCRGGWIAHDYHQDLKQPLEPAAGAVLEKDMPYQGRDTACTGPNLHPYRLTSWEYVGANPASPSDDEMKQAIATHGPIEATVCVGSAFTGYRSGTTFTKDESSVCGFGKVNHAVVLAGWDDTRGPNGSWLLRNSWGTSWGDKGYMWIDRQTSNIGYDSTYIVYPSPGPLPDPIKLFFPLVSK